MNELVRLRVAISTGTGLIAMKFLKGIHGPNRLDLFVDALTYNPAVGSTAMQAALEAAHGGYLNFLNVYRLHHPSFVSC